MQVVVMGVMGSGKSTLGAALAEALGARFEDGDDHHPAGNLAKLAAGEALSDEDRGPWLAALVALLEEAGAKGEDLVLACSALKDAYRERLAAATEDVRFVFLTGSFEELAARLARRRGHFAHPELLRSQLETLEAPSARDALLVPVSLPLDEKVDRLRAALAPG